MTEKKQKEDKNTSRREFLKKMAVSSVFVPPTIKTFSVLQTDSPWWWWTGHHHHHNNSNNPVPPPPPAPPGLG